MEYPAEAAWIPWDSRLTHWGMEAPAAAGDWFQMATAEPAAVWPAPGFPVEYHQYAATEIFGSCPQISIPTSSNGGQLVEYAEATHDDLLMIEEEAGDHEETDRHRGDFHGTEAVTHQNPVGGEFEEAAREFKVDMDVMSMKIHRYPASLRAFDEWYTVPRLVAIGPYHYGVRRDPVEKAKHVAAHHCVSESGRSLQEVYDAVVSAAYDARRLYDKDVVAGMDDGDFLPMMFYDACFLVQYMRWCTDSIVEVDASLCRFFEFNRKVLRHDLMLLQNQLPWLVVETVMSFRPVDLAGFISDWSYYLQERKVLEKPVVVLDDGYQPPHLLGLLRFYMVGRRRSNGGTSKLHTRPKIDSISDSASAVELAEIGITLTAAKNTIELIHMGVNKIGILSAELSLVPLSLDDERASFLLNMAALELCTTPSFVAGEDEDSAVCSYILLLSMLVHREEDVQELRTRHLLQGGAGLINKDALDFLTKLQSLPLRGSCYVRVMVEIEKYKLRRRFRTKVHAFLYKNKRTIITVFSIIGVLVSILGTLRSLKGRNP